MDFLPLDSLPTYGVVCRPTKRPMDFLHLDSLPTYEDVCRPAKRPFVTVEKSEDESTLMYTKRRPGLASMNFKASSCLLPNTLATIQRYYGPRYIGPHYRGPPRASNLRRPFRTPQETLTNPKSVLKKTVSPEELQQPNYRTKVLRVQSDGLGWGFVVRGTGPCHIQTVEPRGPAAVAGMKVCQILASINYQSVLNMDYKSINHLIQTGPMKITIEVMEEVKV